MFMQTIDYQTKEIIAEAAGIPFASVADESILSVDLDLDSLELANLELDLEDKFDVELSNSDVRADMTVADLVRLIIHQMRAVNKSEV